MIKTGKHPSPFFFVTKCVGLISSAIPTCLRAMLTHSEGNNIGNHCVNMSTSKYNGVLRAILLKVFKNASWQNTCGLTYVTNVHGTLYQRS